MQDAGSVPLGWAGSVLMLLLCLAIVDTLARSFFGVRLHLVHEALRAMRRIAQATVRYGARALRFVFRMLLRGLQAGFRELRNDRRATR